MRSTVITCSAILVAGSVAQKLAPARRRRAPRSGRLRRCRCVRQCVRRRRRLGRGGRRSRGRGRPGRPRRRRLRPHLSPAAPPATTSDWAESTGDLSQFDGPTETAKLRRRQFQGGPSFGENPSPRPGEHDSKPHPQGFQGEDHPNPNYPQIPGGGGHPQVFSGHAEPGPHQQFQGFASNSMPAGHGQEPFKSAPSMSDRHDPFGEHGGEAMQQHQMNEDRPMSQQSFHEPPQQAPRRQPSL